MDALSPCEGPISVFHTFVRFLTALLCILFGSFIGEEQLTRQLIGLHRAVTHKDKNLLNQIVKQGTEMSLPLRGVTALSLTLYLRHMDMTSELLAALRKTKQLGEGTIYMLHKGPYFYYVSIFFTIFEPTHPHYKQNLAKNCLFM